MQDHDPIQDGIDAFEIVRGDQHGPPSIGPRSDEPQERLSGNRIESVQRLIEKRHLRGSEHGGAQRQPLSHPL